MELIEQAYQFSYQALDKIENVCHITTHRNPHLIQTLLFYYPSHSFEDLMQMIELFADYEIADLKQTCDCSEAMPCFYLSSEINLRAQLMSREDGEGCRSSVHSKSFSSAKSKTLVEKDQDSNADA